MASKMQDSLEDALRLKGRLLLRKKERMRNIHRRFLDRVADDSVRLMRNTASSFMKRKGAGEKSMEEESVLPPIRE